MGLDVGPGSKRSDEMGRRQGDAPAGLSVYDVWDASSTRSWHTEMQDIGLRLAATKAERVIPPAPPDKVPELPKRRSLRSRFFRICARFRRAVHGRSLSLPKVLKTDG